MTTSTWDPTKIRARGGQIFILPNPYNASTPPSNTTPASAVLVEYLANFYSTGDAQPNLKSGVLPWANIDAKGLDLECKYKPIDFDPALGVPINAGKFVESCMGKIVIGDFSAAKLQDLISTTANETITQVPSSTLAGRTSVMIGTTPYNTRYMVLYRWPSLDSTGTPIPGQFDNLLIPKATLAWDGKANLAKNKATDLTIDVRAENDLWLLSPDSGLGVCAVLQEATAAHS
jgi:hypothetical protein